MRWLLLRGGWRALREVEGQSAQDLITLARVDPAAQTRARSVMDLLLQGGLCVWACSEYMVVETLDQMGTTDPKLDCQLCPTCVQATSACACF